METLNEVSIEFAETVYRAISGTETFERKHISGRVNLLFLTIQQVGASTVNFLKQENFS